MCFVHLFLDYTNIKKIKKFAFKFYQIEEHTISSNMLFLAGLV